MPFWPSVRRWAHKQAQTAEAGEQQKAARPRLQRPEGSFGHTGFTGPSMWIDPFSKTFVIFLCNRVHPTEKGPSVVPLRRSIGSLAVEAVKKFDFANVPGALTPRE